MEFSLRYYFLPIFLVFVLFFFLCSSVFSTRDFTTFLQDNQTFQSDNEMKMKLIKDRLAKINKPFVKSIKSPDGDIIDCVLIHLQPAFDHPKLKGTMPADPPKIPFKIKKKKKMKQLWSLKGDVCPNGTIPIRRTTEEDLLNWDLISKSGKKYNMDVISTDGRHDHAIGRVEGAAFYGIKATLNVWKPRVANIRDFSLSQVWVTTNIPGHPININSIEAGWHVYPLLYRDDDDPRFFIYWTNNGYQNALCYNLQCSGFVQRNYDIALGSKLSPLSIYNDLQYEITISIWKSPDDGNWWLASGNDMIGYWPATLFPDLGNFATILDFGGEVLDHQLWGPHTLTEMGSGHFSIQGPKKAAYTNNVEVFDAHKQTTPATNVRLFATHPECYDVRSGDYNQVWGTHIFFGGRGYNGISCR